MSQQQGWITVEVAYARPEKQYLHRLRLPAGSTALEALQQSGLLERFPDEALADANMGIFSQALDGRLRPTPAEYIMQPGDRLEVYRPLQLDPKQARLARAARAQEKRSGK